MRTSQGMAAHDRRDADTTKSGHYGAVTAPQPWYLVVSGPPGSGKTSLATALAQEMGLPLLAKDLIKETLMSVLVVPDVDASQLIGQAAIEVMYAVAGACSSGAILEANFHRSTSVAGVQGLRDSVVEVFCRCDRQIALARYRERSEHRHPGHFDIQRSDYELWNDEVTAPVAGG